VRKNKSEWKKQLTPLQYDVTRRAATEFAFSGALCDQHAAGSTVASIAATHFSIQERNSTPARLAELLGSNRRRKCRQKRDFSAGVLRTEVKCTLCERAFGTRLHGWAEPTGLRYCMNSAALLFVLRKS